MAVIKSEETKNGRLVVLLEVENGFGEAYVLGVCNKGDEINEENYLWHLAGKRNFNKSLWVLEEVQEEFDETVKKAAAGYIFG